MLRRHLRGPDCEPRMAAPSPELHGPKLDAVPPRRGQHLSSPDLHLSPLQLERRVHQFGSWEWPQKVLSFGVRTGGRLTTLVMIGGTLQSTRANSPHESESARSPAAGAPE